MKRKFLVLLSVVLILALACTACGNKNNNNEDCEHTYSDKWSSNSTEHWHAATCEHAELKSDVAAHTDADQDGKCDVCGYEIGHEHTYADVWTYNVTHHWKIATCSHTDEKGYFALHSDANFDNVCDVCSVAIEFVIPTDVASAVELVANGEKAFPSEWITADKNNVSDLAIPYFMPLIEGECDIKTKNGSEQEVQRGSGWDQAI